MSSSSTRANVSTTTTTPTSGHHSLQYYFNYLQDTSSSTVEHMRLNQLREQLLLLDDSDVMRGVGGVHCHPDVLMRPDSPDNALTQLLCDLRDIEMKDSEESVRGNLFGTGDCSSLLAGSAGSMVGHGNGVASSTTSSSAAGGGVNLNGGLYQHRIAQRYSAHHNLFLGGTSVGAGSGLHQSDLHDLHHHHHQQHVSACRCEQLPHLRGCSLFHHGGVGVRQPMASRKRPYTWIDCAYDDEAFDDGDAEEDVVKQLEQEDDDDELLFGANGVELGASSCSSEEDDDEDDDDEEEEEEDEDEEEEDEEDTCSVASSGGSDRRNVGRRTRRPMQSYQHPASAVRSRSHHRQHQRRRAALVVPASRPYDASATSKSRSKSAKQQKPPKKQLGAEVSYIATEVHVTTAPSSPNSSTDHHHLGAPIAPTHSECHQATHVGDHSYTRPKGRYSIMNELGVQTPSDSEEEIDVVSIGDKNLPTNPTARNRRHLESEVASKIRTASSRPPNGALHYDRHGGNGYHHHHPHHRQQTPQHGHDDVVGGTTRGGAQPLLGAMYPTPAGSTTISGANTPLPTGSGCHSAASSPPPPVTATSSSVSRRRTHGGGAAGSKRGSSGAGGGPSSKRMRQHHSKRSSNGHDGRAGADGAGGLHDELDTVEKRNLHNNMERQRRIGLKNLFEELKRQIPNLRDKDRAPKVNILREAAALCNRLNRESEQINELRQHQKKLYERVRFLRSSMHTQRAQLQHATPVAE